MQFILVRLFGSELFLVPTIEKRQKVAAESDTLIVVEIYDIRLLQRRLEKCNVCEKKLEVLLSYKLRSGVRRHWRISDKIVCTGTVAANNETPWASLRSRPSWLGYKKMLGL